MMLPGGAGAPFPPANTRPAANQSLCFVFRSRWLLRTPVRGGASARLAYHVAAGFPAHAVSQWRSEEAAGGGGGGIPFQHDLFVGCDLSKGGAVPGERVCQGAEQEEERAREQRSKGAKPGDAGLSGDRSRNEGTPPVNNNGVICFQEENTFDTDRCGYCEALLAFTLHPLRPPVITSPFQRRHYCDGYAAFEGVAAAHRWEGRASPWRPCSVPSTTRSERERS
ncbi:hypothetical protein O3P69_012556, partial [Scylla paramamosain]